MHAAAAAADPASNAKWTVAVFQLGLIFDQPDLVGSKDLKGGLSADGVDPNARDVADEVVQALERVWLVADGGLKALP